MSVNYKIIDTQKIVDYIISFPNGVSVDDIILYSGADKLRVYPALFELEQSGWKCWKGRSLVHHQLFVRKIFKRR